MRCTDCNLFKETIPEQIRYVYCSKYQKEMPVWHEFERCPNKTTDNVMADIKALDDETDT